MIYPEITIGAPYSTNVKKKDGTAFSADPYVVLVSKTQKMYHPATISIGTDNAKVATWSSTETAKMIAGPLMLEVWSDSNFTILLKRIEEFTVARNGAPTPGYINANQEEAGS